MTPITYSVPNVKRLQLMMGPTGILWCKGCVGIRKSHALFSDVSAVALAGDKLLHAQLLVSIVDSISACHAEDRGSIPRRGELDPFFCRTTHPKVFDAARSHRRSSASTSA